jgi:hypothetical protein
MEPLRAMKCKKKGGGINKIYFFLSIVIFRRYINHRLAGHYLMSFTRFVRSYYIMRITVNCLITGQEMVISIHLSVDIFQLENLWADFDI